MHQMMRYKVVKKVPTSPIANPNQSFLLMPKRIHPGSSKPSPTMNKQAMRVALM
jgi:hypothetical protein